jgi:Plasmid recombination enzyme
MSFAVLRVAKIKSAGGAGGLSAHLERTMDVPNADKELRHYNQRVIGSGDLWSDIKKKLEDNHITDVRKNGVYAIEILMTASPEHFNFRKDQDEEGKAILKGNSKNWNDFSINSMKWLEKEFGRFNIVNFTTHLDEQTPHIHAVVVPLVDTGKTREVKNNEIMQKMLHSEYRQDPIRKLSAKSFIDGRTALRGLQDTFAEVHKENGLKRGLEGSKAKHTTVKEFYASIKNNPSLKDETLRLINQRANKTESLAEKRLGVLQDVLIDKFGHRLEWHEGKETGDIINIEKEKQYKEREKQQKEMEIKAQEEKIEKQKESQKIQQNSSPKSNGMRM